MAHLYKAGRQHKLVDEWKDMDLFLANHVGSRKGSGARTAVVTKVNPRANNQAAMRHFATALGWPLDAQKTGQLAWVGADTARHISVKSRLIEVMTRTAANCMVLNRAHTLLDVLYSLCASEPGSDSRSVGTRKQEQGPVMPVALLELFEQHLTQDEVSLNFDYVGFYKLCDTLFVGIAAPANPEISLANRPAGLVINLLDEVAYVLDKQPSKRPPGTTSPLDGTAFAAAAVVLNDQIRVQGNKLSKAALEKCSNNIPKHLRPSLAQQQPSKGPSLDQIRERFERLGFTVADTRGCYVVYDSGKGIERPEKPQGSEPESVLHGEVDRMIAERMAMVPRDTDVERESNAVFELFIESFSKPVDGPHEQPAPQSKAPKAYRASVEDALEEEDLDLVASLVPRHASTIIEAVDGTG